MFPAGHACVPRPLSVAVQAGLSRACADAWAAVKNEQDMLQKTEGIVLRTLKYGDASVIVHLYTRQAGRAAFVLAVPRSRRSSLRPAIFQPLAVVEVVADVRPVSDIYKVREAKVVRPFASLPCHPVKAAIVAAVICICLSVAFVKQHSVLDIVAAIPVCLLAEWLVFRNYYKLRRQLHENVS